MTNNPSILVADDHPLFRAALKQAITMAAPIHDVIETQSLSDARAHLAGAAKSAPPDLICLDLHMDDSDGFAGLISLRHDFPTVPVAIVSGSETSDVIRRAIAFGAIAFIPKSLDVDVIKTAINAVLAGDNWVPEHFTQTSDHDDQSAEERLSSLTPTQLKVLILAHKGLLNKQIAYELSNSEATVKAHMTAIFRKLNVQTRTQAVLIAETLIAESASVQD